MGVNSKDIEKLEGQVSAIENLLGHMLRRPEITRDVGEHWPRPFLSFTTHDDIRDVNKAINVMATMEMRHKMAAYEKKKEASQCQSD